MPKQKKVPELEAAVARPNFVGRDWGIQYLDSLSKAGTRRRPSSRRAYDAVWRSYLRFLARSDLDAASASAEIAGAFLRGLANPTTRLRYGRLVAAVYDHAVSQGETQVSPFDKLEDLLSQSETRGPVRTLGTPTLGSLVSRLPAPRSWKEHRDQAMVVLCAAAGLRLREVRELEIFQLSGDAVQPKGSTAITRMLPLPEEAKHFLGNWVDVRRKIEVGGLLAFPAKTGGMLPLNTLHRRIKNVLQALCTDEELEHYGVGVLRAFFAKDFHKPVQAQYSLGHRRLGSTLRYLKQIKGPARRITGEAAAPAPEESDRAIDSTLP